MKNDWQIRRADLADENQLLKIIEPQKSAAFNWSVDNFLSEFQRAQTWVLCDSNQVLGFASLRDLIDAWEISVLATHENFHQQGVMEMLLKYILNTWGHDREIWLEVHENNLAARNLYQKLGFISQSARKSYYSDGASALLFTRPRA